MQMRISFVSFGAFLFGFFFLFFFFAGYVLLVKNKNREYKYRFAGLLSRLKIHRKIPSGIGEYPVVKFIGD